MQQHSDILYSDRLVRITRSQVTAGDSSFLLGDIRAVHIRTKTEKKIWEPSSSELGFYLYVFLVLLLGGIALYSGVFLVAAIFYLCGIHADSPQDVDHVVAMSFIIAPFLWFLLYKIFMSVIRLFKNTSFNVYDILLDCSYGERKLVRSYDYEDARKIKDAILEILSQHSTVSNIQQTNKT